MEKKKSLYKHMISLGSFCSPAIEIERLGYRDASYPFDWVLSHSFNKVLILIQNNFEDFLEEERLVQWKQNRDIYENEEYDIVFVHDFKKYESLKQQFLFVKEKYQRRIERFYCAIKEPTLFIRYIETKEDCNYISANYEAILSIIKSFNLENDIIFIVNNGMEVKGGHKERVFYVEKDKNDTVARRFSDKSKILKEFLEDNYYSMAQKKENLYFFRRKRFKVFVNKIIKQIKKHIDQREIDEYEHFLSK